MIKDLHHSINPVDIIKDLNQNGLKAKNATNKQKWLTAEQKKDRRALGLKEVVPLDMFIVSFDRETDIDKIYNIKTVMSSKVKIEPMRKNKTIPQCKRCQDYGHTQNFCAKTPRCVKCGKQHLTFDCHKPLNSQPKCVHCGENHPANYRGCEVYKDLMKHRNNSAKTQTQLVQQTRQERNKEVTLPQPKMLPQKTANINKTTVLKIASKTKPILQAQIQSTTEEQEYSIETILQQILSRLDKLENKITYG